MVLSSYAPTIKMKERLLGKVPIEEGLLQVVIDMLVGTEDASQPAAERLDPRCDSAPAGLRQITGQSQVSMISNKFGGCGRDWLSGKIKFGPQAPHMKSC